MRTPTGHPPRHRIRERGATSLFAVFATPALLGAVAIATDVGHVWVVRTQLQATADAAALASAQDLPDPNQVGATAIQYASANQPGRGEVLTPSDVEIGLWDYDARSFAAGANPTNAVRVTVRRSEASGNPVRLFFGGVLGVPRADVVATATATSDEGPGIGSRFLIDEEVIDSDIPVIEDLADRLEIPPDELISDNNDDWFIDLPPGEQLELPTGQVGDEGLFDITHEAFPFHEGADPYSFEDFLNWNEDGSWRQDLIPKEMMDPLIGVDRVDDASAYPSFVDPDFVHVSPVWKSDTSAINPVPYGDGSVPAVNALGERRGLMAYKIIGVGQDPDGSGSKLPNLIIVIVDPSSIDLAEVPRGAAAGRILALVD